ncbi:Pimeloyl-ACP methyl ester carboxylesterase [Palleronia marisminoris]|uniref:L-amino acid amidase n=1 Tax=Palleronia marisminoris TaxID=315423 RepID=A0A1Y5TP17_9RHOB|nr:alpha/beta hydrolase [Palleronia marisminoris]SFH47207.1 Pimeloyl-ACP methyl ester carboxylesterase [Palleronia marisminoris]SLN68585.1 L-amino acid amidase [Palleronia marisminoris]
MPGRPTLEPRKILLAAIALCGVLALPTSAQETGARAMSGDLDIYYEVHGDLGSGDVPFLVLHGGMGSIHGDFGDLLPILAKQRPVIGVEQQGHGRTGGRATPVSLEAMRADTLAVLDALEVERVHVVGFSMGGMLALDLGVAAPDRLETLTAISVSQNVDGMHPAIAEMNRNPGSPPSPEVLELMPTEEDFGKIQAGFAANPDGPEQFQRTFAQLQAFMVSDWGWTDEELASIEVPSLIVLGDADFTTVDHAAHMSKLIGAQLAVLPDTTHLSIMRRARWLAPLIENRIATAGD